ncbi:MAG TPA: PepSY-associated TM helix domain-containing protein [Puia sp.]|nr:PepSY-associated TM helix domain-containing protein [Puia sp.]
MAIKKKNKLKYLIHQLHLYGGLTSGVVVIIVALTGCLYVFEEEGRELFQHDYLHVKTVGSLRLPLHQMMDTVKAHYPRESIASIRFKENQDASFLFFTKSQNSIAVDPYTARIMGTRDQKTDFFLVVRELHTHLLLGKVGGEIIRWNVLIFLVLCISGLVLWWPRQKKFFQQAARINFKTKNWKRFNWDLHSVLGFYAVLVLLIISLTGLFWTFDTAKGFVRFLTHEPAPEKEEKPRSQPMGRGGHFTMDDAYRYMSTHYPGAKETFITPPEGNQAPIRVLMRYPYTIVRKQNNVFFDRYSGQILKQELFTGYSAYDKVARSNYDFHTGSIRFLGIGSKIIWFLASLMAASLPVTGFLIWWGRKKKPASRKIVNNLNKEPRRLVIVNR